MIIFSKNSLKEDFRIINPIKSIEYEKSANLFKDKFEKQMGREMTKAELYYRMLTNAVFNSVDDSSLLSTFDEVRFFHRRYNLARLLSFDSKLPKVNSNTKISDFSMLDDEYENTFGRKR